MKLVEFGFNYSDLIEMPLDEFIEYAKLLIEIRDRENRVSENRSSSSNKKPDGKPIGAVIPRKN